MFGLRAFTTDDTQLVRFKYGEFIVLCSKIEASPVGHSTVKVPNVMYYK